MAPHVRGRLHHAAVHGYPISAQLDAFAQASNAQFQLFGDPVVFEEGDVRSGREIRNSGARHAAVGAGGET